MSWRHCFRLVLVTVVSLTASPTLANLEKMVRRQALAKDVEAAIAIVAPAKSRRDVVRAMSQAFTRARHLLSLLDERQPASETSLLNSHAGGTPIKAGPELLSLLVRGGQLAELTGGAFDMTMGSRSGKASYRDLWIDRTQALAALKRRGARVSVWGMLRGYLADGMARELTAQGWSRFLINVGGKLRASGRDVERSWMVGIQDPLARVGESVCRLPLADQGLATSSFKSYRIDLGTKISSPLFASVSVVAPDAATADALAHAGMLLGDKAAAVYRGLVSVGAIFITGSGQVQKVGSVAAACFGY